MGTFFGFLRWSSFSIRDRRLRAREIYAGSSFSCCTIFASFAGALLPLNGRLAGDDGCALF